MSLTFFPNKSFIHSWWTDLTGEGSDSKFLMLSTHLQWYIQMFSLMVLGWQAHNWFPEQQQEQMWHTFTFLTDPTGLPRLKVSFWSQQLLKFTHASKLHMMQNGSRVSKSVSWKIEENSSFSTKPAPLKIKNDYSDRMLLVGGYITLCKCRKEVQEDTNYFQHQQQWWEQLFLIHGKSEFLWLMKVLNG